MMTKEMQFSKKPEALNKLVVLKSSWSNYDSMMAGKKGKKIFSKASFRL